MTSDKKEYVFEYSNQELTSKGKYYKVPDVCVTGCELLVRGSGSSASKVAAYMTDSGDNRVLSCVRSVDTSNLHM